MRQLFILGILLCLSAMMFAWAWQPSWLPAIKVGASTTQTNAAQPKAAAETTTSTDMLVSNNDGVLTIPAKQLPEGFGVNIALFKQTFDKMDGVRSIELLPNGDLQVAMQPEKAQQVRNAFGQILENVNRPQMQATTASAESTPQIQLTDEQMSQLKMDMYKKYGNDFEQHLIDYLQGNDKKRAESSSNPINSPTKASMNNEK